MGGVATLARTHLRRRWRALAALGLLAGVIGSAVLASATMARRTGTAYDRLTRATASEDMRALAFGPDLAERVVGLPGIASSWVPDIVLGKVRSEETVSFFAVIAGPTPPPNLFRPIVIEGRMFDGDEPDEVVVSEQFADASGFGVGDRIPLDLLSVDDLALFETGIESPRGPAVTLHVTGRIRYPGSPDGLANIVASPAFRERYVTDLTDIGGVVLIRLARGAAGADAFLEQVRQLATQAAPPDEVANITPLETFDPRDDAAAVAGTARVLVTGLAVFAAVVAVAGGFVLVQVAVRHHAASVEEQATERAIGLTRAQRAIARTLPAAPAGLIAASVACATAVVTSKLAPLGAVATFEPSPGTEVNAGALGIGAIGIILAVMLIEAIAAARAGRARPQTRAARPSLLAERMAHLGARPSIVIGLRFSFEGGRGRRAVPVRSVLAGAVIGIAGLVAVTSFGASLSRLTSDPRRYGHQDDFTVVDFKDRERARLLADPRIDGVTEVRATSVRLSDGDTLAAYALEPVRGDVGWTLLEGRPPTGPLEVVIGTRLAARQGLGIGELLELREPRGGLRSLTVVGVGLGPNLNSEPFGYNVLLAPSALEQLSATGATREAFVSVAPEHPVEVVVNTYRADMELFEQARPVEVENLHGLGALPLVLAALLGLFAIAAIGNALVVGVRRRAVDLAILRTLGMVARQLRGTVRINGVTTALVGLIIGVPGGIALAKASWRAVASSAYVGTDTHVPTALLAGVAPAALVAAIVLAIVPGRRAARTHPAAMLHVE